MGVQNAPLIFFGLLQIIADYCRLFLIIPIDSMDTTIQTIVNYSISVLIILIIRIIPIIAFGLYRLFVPDNFKTAFPPSSLHGISSHFDHSSA